MLSDVVNGATGSTTSTAPETSHITCTYQPGEWSSLTWERKAIAIAASTVVALGSGVFTGDVQASSHCSYKTGSQSPQVRDLTAAGGASCTSARKVVTAVRIAGDWRSGLYSDTWGYVDYATGGYGDDGYLNVRKWRCTYERRGITRKYVLSACRTPPKSNGTPARRGWLVSFRLYGG